MGRELELKFKADEGQLAAIRGSYGPFHEISMETAYFDTKDRFFTARRETLRRRYENGIPVYALKTHLSDGSHGEWETTAASLEEAIEKLCKLGAPNLEPGTELEILCAARFTRSCAEIVLPGGMVELALDEGALLGGGKSMPLSEVELELKQGEDSVLHSFGKLFAEEFRLEEEPLSKFARARSLAGNA